MANNKKISAGVIVLIIALVLLIAGGISLLSSKEKETNKNNKPETTKKEDTTTKVEPLDLKKGLNNSNNTYSNPLDATSSAYGLSMKVNSDKTSVSLSIAWATFGPLVGMTDKGNEVKTYQITGFTSKVKNAYIGSIGQDITGVTLFFLMEDSTVSYMPMFVLRKDDLGNIREKMNYTDDNFTVTGLLPKVKDVVNLYTVTSTSGVSSASTTIGATKDGSFYDLGELFTNKDF